MRCLLGVALPAIDRLAEARRGQDQRLAYVIAGCEREQPPALRVRIARRMPREEGLERQERRAHHDPGVGAEARCRRSHRCTA
jgi:hypothetical protein